MNRVYFYDGNHKCDLTWNDLKHTSTYFASDSDCCLSND